MNREIVESQNQYGKQLDLTVECKIRYSVDQDQIRIFVSGHKPIYIGKETAAFESLKELFVDTEE